MDLRTCSAALQVYTASPQVKSSGWSGWRLNWNGQKIIAHY
jgi:hypothetical protein